MGSTGLRLTQKGNAGITFCSPMKTSKRQGISRRGLFEFVADETLAFVEGALGKPSLKLSHLSDLGDSEFAQLIPQFADGTDLVIRDGRIEISAGSSAPNTYCMEQSVGHSILRNINGKFTCDEIASRVGTQWDLASDQAMGEVRALILSLVAGEICFPVNLPKTHRQHEE